MELVGAAVLESDALVVLEGLAVVADDEGSRGAAIKISS
jgi:hypothetical protein